MIRSPMRAFALLLALAGLAAATSLPTFVDPPAPCAPQEIPGAFVRRIRRVAQAHTDPEIRAALLALADRNGLGEVVCAWEDTGATIRKVNKVADAYMKREHPGLRWKRIRTYQKTSEPEHFWFVLYRSQGNHVEEVEVRVDTRDWSASE